MQEGRRKTAFFIWLLVTAAHRGAGRKGYATNARTTNGFFALCTAAHAVRVNRLSRKGLFLSRLCTQAHGTPCDGGG